MKPETHLEPVVLAVIRKKTSVRVTIMSDDARSELDATTNFWTGVRIETTGAWQPITRPEVRKRRNGCCQGTLNHEHCECDCER